MSKRDDRLDAIRRLVRTHEVRTQTELTDLLAGAGYDCTQATISRDIADLQLEKGRESRCYELPEDVKIRSGVLSAVAAGHLVVLKTSQGNAQGIAAVLDSNTLPGVLGTIAGDDTILMVADTPENAVALQDFIMKRKRG